MEKAAWKQAMISVEVEPLVVPATVSVKIGDQLRSVSVAELSRFLAVELASEFTAAFVAQARP